MLIGFLCNSCNFQYLILGWPTLVLDPSIIMTDYSPVMTLCSQLSDCSQLFLSQLFEYVDEGEKCVRCEGVEGVGEFVRACQQYAMAQHHLARY